MASLAHALANRGHKVKYIAQKESLPERTELGWNIPSLGAAELVMCTTPADLRELADSATVSTEHIFQGFRGNGYLSEGYKALSRRKIAFWIFMETVDNRGLNGLARRAYYRQVFARWTRSLKGVLAVGADMPKWLLECGVSEQLIVPFTYFLPEPPPSDGTASNRSDSFQIMFVGKLTRRKGVDVLLHALSDLREAAKPSQVIIVGAGPELGRLQALSQRMGISASVTWLGNRGIDEIPGLMKEADLLVLPSRFDGWGAVVTEALMAGTPTIATDMCGAAEAVRASGCGAVVPAGNPSALAEAIVEEVSHGPVTAEFRSQLACWARAFGARQGAEYLSAVLDTACSGAEPPCPPWLVTRPPERFGPPFGRSELGVS